MRMLSPTGLDLPIPPFPDPLEPVLLQPLLTETVSACAKPAVGGFELALRRLVSLQTDEFAFEFNELRVSPNGVLLLGWQLGGKTLLPKLRERLEIIHVVMLGGFVQEGRFAADGGGVRHVALTVYARIGLIDVLRSFDFGIPACGIL